MNPHLNKDCFVSRKEKLKSGFKKLKSIAKNVWDKAKNICKLEIIKI